jgi:sec-independent protein translocase protein TatA
VDLGWPELLVILGLALLLFGPSRLSGLGKSMGEAFRGFKRGLKGIEDPRPTRDVREIAADSDANSSSQTTKQNLDKQRQQ